MDESTLSTLEFPFVLDELSRHTRTPYGRELAQLLRPSADATAVARAFAELKELSSIIDVPGLPPIGELIDIRPLIKGLAPSGAYLSSEDLLEIRKLLGAVAAIELLLSELDPPAVPLLSDSIVFSDQSFLLDELRRVLDDEGKLTDDASPELKRVRREIRSLKGSARKLLDRFTGDPELKNFLQDDLFTIREDRYVLAIKAGFHMHFKGIIHGRSASEQTYFIEPFETIELNNRLQILKKEERGEEIRILKELSEVVSEEAESLKSDISTLAHLDLLSAKCVLGRELSAVIPELTEDGRVELRSARHPLLILKERREGTRAVPIDIIIGDGVGVLVISGANTGGKTAALKTLGLLTAMAASGLPLPASEGSVVNLFSRLFADIGDSQDLASNLSTFSAHIKKMGEFLSASGPSTLVLIDEIGVGTDPAEGRVFALSVLEALRDAGAVTVVTTHINLLKARAASDPAFMNASVVFDAETLKPSYTLSYGMPGSSFGLSIAEELGIPSHIVERARGMLTGGEGAYMESLREMEAEKEHMRSSNERLARLAEARDEAVTQLREDRAGIVEKIKKRAEARVKEAEVEIKAVVKRLREAEREGLTALKGGAKKAGAEAVGEVRSAVENLFPAKKEAYLPSVGDRVVIEPGGSGGVVVKVLDEEKEVELMVGKIKVKAPWDRLRKKAGGTGRGAAAATKHVGVVEAERPDVRHTLNIIGERVEEALKEVATFIDDANVNGLREVEIIHGMGTGALKSAVTEYLNGRKEVKRISSGGPGATVAELG